MRGLRGFQRLDTGLGTRHCIRIDPYMMYVTRKTCDPCHGAIAMIALDISHLVGSAVSIAQAVSRLRGDDGLPRVLLLHLYACGLNTEVCIMYHVVVHLRVIFLLL